MNFQGERGRRPEAIPDPEPWPDAKAFRSGEAQAPPYLWVEGYAYRKQLCRWTRVTREADGSLRTRRFLFYRVGKFDDGTDAFELDLQNGVVLALKIDPEVPTPESQMSEGGERADPDLPSTWRANVRAAWWGPRGKRPVPVAVSTPQGPGALPDDASVYNEITNAVVTGPNAVVCEAQLDWSQLIPSLDPFASDPLEPFAMTGRKNVPWTIGGVTAVLHDGRVLIAGGWIDRKAVAEAEVFDPKSGEFTQTGACHSKHGSHAMSTCGDGLVLLVPGWTAPKKAPAELWDPSTGAWTETPASAHRYYCPASVTLADGRVLVVDGEYGGADRPAEIFDAKTMTWSETGQVRVFIPTVTLTRLSDGRVLMVGRDDSTHFQLGESVARLYDPVANAWKIVAAPADVRCAHTATLLRDGRVLIAGGAFFKPDCEIFDPATEKWSPTGKMLTERGDCTTTLLPDGRVLILGGSFPMPSPPDLPAGEVFDPATGLWSAAAKDAEFGASPAAILLGDGRLLVISGNANAALFRIRK